MTTAKYFEEYEAAMRRFDVDHSDRAEEEGWQPKPSQPLTPQPPQATQTQYAGPSSFLALWNDFFAKATDAPMNYGEMAGLMCLSTVALGRCRIERGRAIRPNLFAMLSGPSSTARKSTAIQYARDAILAVEPGLAGPRDYTIEGLIKFMDEADPTHPGQKKTRLCLFAEEFGNDLAKRETYNTSMDTDFCALYDGESFQKVRAKSKTMSIESPRVNLFAACAHHLLERFLDSTDWHTGFMTRFIFMEPLGVRSRFVIQPHPPTAELNAALTALQNITAQLSTLKSSSAAVYHLSPGASEVYESFVAVLDAEIARNPEDTTAQTYMGRFHNNTLKLALLFQIDIAIGNGIISREAMERATSLAYFKCWPSFKTCVAVSTKRDPESIQQRLLSIIGQKGGALKSDLGQMFRGNRGLLGALHELERMQAIKAVPVDNGYLRYFPFNVDPWSEIEKVEKTK